MKIFLGFAFRPEDRELAGFCDQLISSHFALPVTGEGLGGDALTPAVQTRIDGCDAMIGLLTRRDALQSGKFTTHQWVRDELAYARNHQKKAIAMIETDVDVGGMYQENEYIPLDRANPLPAFLRLAATIGGWKHELGRSIKVQLLPEMLAKKVGVTTAGTRCFHRLWSRGKTGPWTEVMPVPELGGTFVWIEGVKEDDLIQLKVEHGASKRWESSATSQWMQVLLTNGARV